MMNNRRTDSAPPVNYAIGLVVYHAEKAFFKRLGKVLALGVHVFLFDNSPELGTCTPSSVKKKENFHYITSGKNVGLGSSLRILCATAHAHGFSRLLFLDQDTGISERTLDFIQSYTAKLPTDLQSHYVTLVFNGTSSTSNSVTEVRLAISSGSLFNLSLLKEVGWHNEEFFVDCVDYELCIRARRRGFKIGVVNNTPDFDHVSEQPDRALNLFGKRLLVRRYSAKRIRDAIGAYFKLIIGGFFQNRSGDNCALTRSMALYIFGQLASRLIQSK